jgi:sugar O-acyltransferase (sialic acid O-acetyltransferase NeuD family)
MSKKVIILGAGGHGKVVGEIAFLNGFTEVSYLDDDYANIINYPFAIKGSLNEFDNIYNQYDAWFVAIGDNFVRKNLILKFYHFSKNLINLIHPNSVISNLSNYENGICIMASATINPGCKIKCGSIINTSASIDHDCIVGPFAHVAPNVGLSGNVTVGECSLIGTGSSVQQNIRIGNQVKIGIGSKIFKNISDHTIFKN